MRLSRFRPFYGWYILAGSSVILFFVMGSRAMIGVMFKPLLYEFSWSRGAISAAVFLNMTIFALSLTFVGKLYDRYGPRWIIIISSLFLAAGFIGIGFIDYFWQFMILYGVFAALGFGGTSVPLFAALSSKWFVKHRGLAASLALTGTCLGQYVIVPASTQIMLVWGWRSAFIIVGSVILVVNFFITFTVIKSHPGELGLKPYGSKEPPLSHPRNESITKIVCSFGLKDAMGTRSFWLFAIVMAVCGGGDYLVLTHLVPMATDHGVSPVTAGNMLAWSGLMSLAGLLLTGATTDRIGNKIPIVFTFILRLAVFVLLLNSQTILSFYIFSLVFGFTMLVTAPIATTLTGKLYGFENVGYLSGFITTIHHFGGGLLAFLAGILFDYTNSYQPAIAISAALSILAIICGIFIKEEKHAMSDWDI